MSVLLYNSILEKIKVQYKSSEALSMIGLLLGVLWKDTYYVLDFVKLRACMDNSETSNQMRLSDILKSDEYSQRLHNCIAQIHGLLSANLQIIGLLVVSEPLDKFLLNSMVSLCANASQYVIANSLLFHHDSKSLSEIKGYIRNELSVSLPFKVAPVSISYHISYPYIMPVHADFDQIQKSFDNISNQIAVTFTKGRTIILKAKSKQNTKIEDIQVYCSVQPNESKRTIEGAIKGIVYLLNGMSVEDVTKIIVEDIISSINIRLKQSEKHDYDILPKRILVQTSLQICQYCYYIMPFEDEDITQLAGILGETIALVTKESIKCSKPVITKEKPAPKIVEAQPSRDVMIAKEKKCIMWIGFGFLVCFIATVVQLKLAYS